jgi:RNA polymerase sigma-70 factor (ECF subfamily)
MEQAVCEVPTSLEPAVTGATPIREHLQRWIDFGDEAAFREVVRHHLPGVRRVVARILPDRSLQDDAVQLTLISLSRHARAVRGELGPWLHSCARNHAIDLRCAAARRHRVCAQDLASEQAAPDQAALEHELHSLVFSALDRLDPEARALVVGHHLEGRSIEELAASSSTATRTIQRRLHRARTTLRFQLIALGLVDAVRSAAQPLFAPSRTWCVFPFDGGKLTLLVLCGTRLLRASVQAGARCGLALVATCAVATGRRGLLLTR